MLTTALPTGEVATTRRRPTGGRLLVGGRAARVGWAAVIVFHLLLVVFGWWVWAWAVPALALLVFLAHRDLEPTGAPR